MNILHPLRGHWLACLTLTLFAFLSNTAVALDSGEQMQKFALKVGSVDLTVEVAATPEQDKRGLMFRNHLDDNAGMIFILPVGRATFWMKNTLIPLSVAFLDVKGTILEIHNMAPGDPALPDNALPRTISESDKVAYAIETNLNWFKLNGVKIGDKVSPLPNHGASLNH